MSLTFLEYEVEVRWIRKNRFKVEDIFKYVSSILCHYRHDNLFIVEKNDVNEHNKSVVIVEKSLFDKINDIICKIIDKCSW